MNQVETKGEEKQDQDTHTLNNVTVVIKIPKKRGRKAKVRNAIQVLNVEKTVSFT